MQFELGTLALPMDRKEINRILRYKYATDPNFVSRVEVLASQIVDRLSTHTKQEALDAGFGDREAREVALFGEAFTVAGNLLDPDEIRVRLDQGSREPRFTLRGEPVEGVVHFAIKGSQWDVRGTSSFIEEVKVGET